MQKKVTLIIMAIVIFGLTGWVFFLSHKIKKQEAQVLAQENMQKKYPLLSKRIFATNPNDIVINFIPLREALNEYVGKQEDKVGVYFEYLPSGISIGVNDREEVKLASLSKVPLVMSIFKKIEQGKLSLNDILVVKKENLDQEFGTLWEKGEGTNLSVEELVRLSLAESDNTAYYTLSDQLTGQEIDEVYKNLDIPMNQEEKDSKVYPLVSPKNYSSIFRSLYLSSFLSEENSNRILEILTKTAFKDKIPAGVPENISIAHKVGVFAQEDTSQDVFIDCGIVYVPERPYILCVFVLDTDKKAQEHIALISKMVYSYLTRVKGEN
ncbi:MAG: serine hydrolase [Patescibacteria group bacterium]